ncbi:MAG TPA: CPBP family intramembrane metalloprotease [Lacibacter sp.]|nr:CPBP family intramembrane metalloprotease [Lacibacter sp.]HMO89178.1 CPBP family intramembrane metalloprotease [Lacibacter sp.]HMP87418.1 CPBP family intramembrane metalloprotease [Lacibacter sp.]
MSLLFLILVAAGLPLLSALSYRNIKQLEEADSQVQFAKGPIYLQSMLLQLILTGVAWLCARSEQMEIALSGTFTWLTVGAAVLFVGGALALAGYSQKNKQQQEESTLHHILPETNRDRLLWALAVVVAAFCEEYVYRGVLFQLMLLQTGGIWIAAALLSAVVFAFGHGTQGERAILQIIPFALGFQALAWLSGGLLLPMIAHFVYNMTVELLFGEQLKRDAGR